MAKRNRAKLTVKLTYSPMNGERGRLHRVMALLLDGKNAKLPQKTRSHPTEEVERGG